MWPQGDRRERMGFVLKHVSDFCVNANKNGLPLAFTFTEPDWFYRPEEFKPLVVEFRLGTACVIIHLRQDQMMYYKDNYGWVTCMLNNAVSELTRILCNS